MKKVLILFMLIVVSAVVWCWPDDVPDLAKSEKTGGRKRDAAIEFVKKICNAEIIGDDALKNYWVPVSDSDYSAGLCILGKHKPLKLDSAEVYIPKSFKDKFYVYVSAAKGRCQFVLCKRNQRLLLERIYYEP